MKNKQTPLLLFNILLYVLSSIAILHFFYFTFTDAISGLHDILTLIPALLVLIIPVYLFFLLNTIIPLTNNLHKYRAIIIHSAIIVFISLWAFIQLIVGLVIAYDGQPTNNQFTSYFPIDFMVYALISLIIALGFMISSLKEFKKIKQENNGVLQEKRPQNTIESPLPLPNKGKIIYLIFAVIFILFSMYFFAQGLIGVLTIDLLRPENLLGSIVIIILCFMPTILILIYYFGYLKIKEERKARFYLHHLIYAFALLLLLIILYIVQYVINPMFIVESLQAFFPIDFAGSINLGPFILIILNITPLIYAFIIFLLRTLKKK